MINISLESKQRRTVVSKLESLGGKNAFLSFLGEVDLSQIDIMKPHLNTKRGKLFLTDNSIDIMQSICTLIYENNNNKNFVTMNEIFQSIKSYYETTIDNGRLSYSGLVEYISISLKKNIKEYRFLICIDGFELARGASINIGTFKIINSDENYLRSLNSPEVLTSQRVSERVNQYSWLVGSLQGSAKKISEVLDYKSILIEGLLNIYYTVLDETAIYKSRIQLLTSGSTNKFSSIKLLWFDKKDYNIFYHGESKSKVKLTEDIVNKLTENLYLEYISDVIHKSDKNEIENSISRALYWYSEAIRDENLTMKFVKLWSCIECFFSIDKKDIVNNNKKGLASILIFGGYEIYDVSDYKSLKVEISKMYDLRSKALHGAFHTHINYSDLILVAKWSTWSIITISSLSVENGFTHLSEIKDQARRLDGICTGKKAVGLTSIFDII